MDDFSDFSDFSDTEETQFGGFIGGYSDPQKAMNDLSGITQSVAGISATLSMLPGGEMLAVKIAPILSQIQSIAGIILGMNSGLKTLQEKVFSDLSNAMSAAVNSAVVASNTATNQVLVNAGIPLVPNPRSGTLRSFSTDDEGNVVDPDGNVIGPPGSTIDPSGNVVDPEGNVVATPADISTPAGNTSGEGNTGTGEGNSGTGEGNSGMGEGNSGNSGNSGMGEGNSGNANSGGGRRKTMKWRNHATRRKKKANVK